jgi:hypothetical protein
LIEARHRAVVAGLAHRPTAVTDVPVATRPDRSGRDVLERLRASAARRAL